jgi:inorganic pyrophosphatase
MTDEAGRDYKILAVPIDKLCKSYHDIKSIDDVDATLKDQIEHFFTYYKDLDEGKWVKIDGWGDAKEAKKELQDSFNAYQK